MAHLVPPTARIIDEELVMVSLALALLNQEADFLATTWRDSDFHGLAGDIVGRFFAWAWRTDKQLFMKYLSQYHEYLCLKLRRQFDAAEVLDLLHAAMEVSLTRNESDAACRFGLSHPGEYFYYQLPGVPRSTDEKQREAVDTLRAVRPHQGDGTKPSP